MNSGKILVTGATGATGGNAIRLLKASGHDVRAFAHEEGPGAEELRSLGIEVVFGDLLNIDSVKAALDGVQSAYFVYPLAPNILAGTVNFAQAAKEAGVGAIVNTSQMTSRREAESHAAKDHWLAEQVLDWSGVPVIHLRPTLFAEWLLYPFSWEDYKTKDVLSLPFGEGRFAPIAAEDQGRVIAALLADPTPHLGKLYKLFGPVELDGHGIAAEVSEALGRSVSYQPVSVEAFLSTLDQLPSPYSSDFFKQHIGAIALDCQNGITSGTNDNVLTLTGKASMSIPKFVAKNRASF